MDVRIVGHYAIRFPLHKERSRRYEEKAAVQDSRRAGILAYRVVHLLLSMRYKSGTGLERHG